MCTFMRFILNEKALSHPASNFTRNLQLTQRTIYVYMLNFYKYLTFKTNDLCISVQKAA